LGSVGGVPSGDGTPWTSQDEVLLEVTDTGMGISADEREQMCTRFFRSEAVRLREIPGTGLGLSIADAVVDIHGGRLAVASQLGVGTTVGVHLPRLNTGLLVAVPNTEPALVAG
jgi:signal transduction histidine kinase